MRVLHVIPAVAARYGGPSRAVFEMGAAVRAHGVETVVATTDADGAGRLALPTGMIVEHRGLPTVFFPRQWSEAFKYSAPLARWLLAEAAGFDVVHVHAVFSHSSLAAGRAARRRGVPYVVRPLGTLDPWSLAQKRGRKRLLWRLGASRLVRGAAAIHYTSAAERRGAEAIAGAGDPGRGAVIPLGVDPDLLAAPPPPGVFRREWPVLGEAPYVLALGRLHPKKGLETLLRAFAGVAGPEWRLVIAGDGEPAYVAGLRRLAADLGAGARVVFTGWLEGGPRAGALRDAALLALPSRQENFALSVVEALACAVPVVISDAVNLADDVRAAGAGWVVSLDEAALAAGLGEALDGEPERARRGKAGRELVERRFTWTRIGSDLADLYRALAPRAA